MFLFNWSKILNVLSKIVFSDLFSSSPLPLPLLARSNNGILSIGLILWSCAEHTEPAEKKKRLQHLSFAYGLPLHYSVRLSAA